MRFQITKTLGPSLRKGEIHDWTRQVVSQLSRQFGVAAHEWLRPEDAGESYTERIEKVSEAERIEQSEREEKYTAWREQQLDALSQGPAAELQSAVEIAGGAPETPVEATNEDAIAEEAQGRVREAEAKLRHAETSLAEYRAQFSTLVSDFSLVEKNDEQQNRLQEARSGILRWENKVCAAKVQIVEAERDLERLVLEVPPVENEEMVKIAHRLRTEAVGIVSFDLADLTQIPERNRSELVFTEGPFRYNLLSDFTDAVREYAAIAAIDGQPHSICSRPEFEILFDWARTVDWN